MAWRGGVAAEPATAGAAVTARRVPCSAEAVADSHAAAQCRPQPAAQPRHCGQDPCAGQQPPGKKGQDAAAGAQVQDPAGSGASPPAAACAAAAGGLDPDRSANPAAELAKAASCGSDSSGASVADAPLLKPCGAGVEFSPRSVLPLAPHGNDSAPAGGAAAAVAARPGRLVAPVQNSLLLFVEPQLEACYGMYHNSLMSRVDLLWVAFGLVLLPVSYLGYLRRGAEAPVGAWVRCFLLPFASLAVKWRWPAFWLRYREAFWCADRLDLLLACSTPGSWVFADAASARTFAYGFSGLLVNAVGHKVRLHVQVILSAIGLLVAGGFMACNWRLGMPAPAPAYLLQYVAVTVLLPCGLVAVADLHCRKLFLAMLRRKRRQQQHA